MDRIVVGVDGSAGSATAVAWALKLATETGAKLEAVLVWEMFHGWVEGYWPSVEDWSSDAEKDAQARLDAAIAVAVEGHPDHIEIRTTIVEGQPAEALLAHAKGADLLVVGSRGRGGFAGLVLGSVSQQCVHHALVPVVVVPEPD
jgi:nucleotide-binding universal stress UspA family protein